MPLAHDRARREGVQVWQSWTQVRRSTRGRQGHLRPSAGPPSVGTPPPPKTSISYSRILTDPNTTLLSWSDTRRLSRTVRAALARGERWVETLSSLRFRFLPFIALRGVAGKFFGSGLDDISSNFLFDGIAFTEGVWPESEPVLPTHLYDIILDDDWDAVVRATAQCTKT